MIEIIQKKVNLQSLVNSLTKTEEIKVLMNKDLIKKDIDRLKNMLNDAVNRYDEANIKALIKYLKKLCDNIDDNSELEMCWVKNGKLVKSYPLNLINEKLYGIDLCNYIELDKKEHLVEIDTTELADIMAFEFMYRDLGEDHDSIEALFSESPVIGFIDSEILTKYFKENGDKVFELSKSMRVGNTPYFQFDNHKIHDYFDIAEFDKDTYRDVVNFSCTVANMLVVDELIKNSVNNRTTMKLLMVDSTHIAFIATGTSKESIEKMVLDNISIRSFGRQFAIKPDVQIF